MSTHNHTPTLYIKKVRGMGRGVFAGRAFQAGEVIEICPVIALPESTNDSSHGGGLVHYVFKWGKNEELLAVALGYGSLYNHSPNPNAAFQPRISTQDIVFKALRAIAPDEQIFIDYGWDEEDYAAFRRPAKSSS